MGDWSHENYDYSNPETWECCNSSHPCGVNEGSCYDDHRECFGDLLCGQDSCAPHFHHWADCCFDPKGLQIQWWQIPFG